MKNRLVLVLPLVLGSWATVGWALSEGSPKVPPEVKEVFVRYDRAVGEHDLAGVMAAFAPDNNTVLLGTGEGERWLGKEEIQAAYAELFKSFDPGSRETRCTWTKAEVKSNLAWVASMCWVSDFLKNEKREYATNLTIVLEQLDSKWYFRVVHFSNNNAGEDDSGGEN